VLEKTEYLLLGGHLARQIFGEAIEAIIGERLGLYILFGYWKG
jgi:hypothetical protein